jgi:YD repeat-containing protein
VQAKPQPRDRARRRPSQRQRQQRHRPGAVLPANSRKTSTQWHPQWPLQTRLAEPGRLTTWVYNGQPDPFTNNAIASCAPPEAKLIDGQPIVVLCKQVEQASTDATGALGFAAGLDANAFVHTQSWTYNSRGQILSHDGPRTDANDTTRYGYHPATTADVTVGDLAQITTPWGSTRLTRYNKAGKLLQSIDANGIVTEYTYDVRQRLKSVSIQAVGQPKATTTYDYHPTGLLRQVTEPDGSFVTYHYDDAERLIRLQDGLDNRIDYTLDHQGQRTHEQVKDPANLLRRAAQRNLDALGRLQQLTGRE